MSCLLGSFNLKIVKSFSKSTVEIGMISKVMIKFRSKFQFQIPLQFYRQLKKLKLEMVMVKSFSKYHHLSNLPILVTILFFMIEIQAYWV